MAQLSYSCPYEAPVRKKYHILGTTVFLLLLLILSSSLILFFMYGSGLNQLTVHYLKMVGPKAILESAMPLLVYTSLPADNANQWPKLAAMTDQLFNWQSPLAMLHAEMPLLYPFDASNQKDATAKPNQPAPLDQSTNQSTAQSQITPFTPFTKNVNGVNVVYVGTDEYYPVKSGYSGNLALASIKNYFPLVKEYSAQYNLNPSIPLAIMRIESGGNPEAVSDKGALGIMQITKPTASEWGLTDPLNPDESIKTGIKILHYYYSLYNGNLSLTAAAYNAGCGAVAKYNGVPNYGETQNYVIQFNFWYTYYNSSLQTAQG